MTSGAHAVSEVAVSLKRHDLVWLHGHIWEQALLTELDDAQRKLAQSWFQAGYPAVVRRRTPQEPEGGVTLGIPLPPQRGRARLALCMAPTAVQKAQRPPTLKAMLPAIPSPWRLPLARLAASVPEEDGSVRVYGSLMWQHLTGEIYLHAGSDVDLLWEVNDVSSLRRVIALLRRWERDFGLRADGEVLLRDGWAVAWRELAGAQARVLAKAISGVELMARSTVISALAP